MSQNCVFCSRNEFAVVAENNDAVAIICNNAKSWGHSLIIPRNHSSNLASVGMNEAIWKGGIVPLMREFIIKLKKNPQVIGFFINSNAGSQAEQSVFHTHIHVVPVYLKDKDKWIAFFNGSTSEGSKHFPGPWENLYPDMMAHINACLGKTLKKDGEGVIESFNLVARVGDGELGGGEHFWIIPKPSSYHWQGGANSKYYDFQQRKEIAERIKNGQWEEEKPNGSEKNNNEGKEKDFKEPKGSEKGNNSQEQKQQNDTDNQKQNQGGDSQEPSNNQKSSSFGKENDKEENNQNRENEENRKKNEKPDGWRETLKEVDNSLEQVFDDTKISEWQGQGSFNTAESVKKLLESVKSNNDFLTEIKSKHSITGLSDLIVNKSPQQVIIIIKKFEYNRLSVPDKESKDKKIKAYYRQLNQLAKNGKLTEEQINEYLYKQAIGEINENSIKVDANEQKNTKPPERNLAKTVKVIGIIFLLMGGFFLILLIRKRKKRLDR